MIFWKWTQNESDVTSAEFLPLEPGLFVFGNERNWVHETPLSLKFLEVDIVIYFINF